MDYIEMEKTAARDVVIEKLDALEKYLKMVRQYTYGKDEWDESVLDAPTQTMAELEMFIAIGLTLESI